MLQLPNLDDRQYEQMVAEARKSIPKLLAQWTDENAHDPGITFIELFAWLTEMQQYYLNQVTDENEKKFLKLLGVKQRIVQSARTNVSFDRIEELTVLPRGTKLRAMEQCFETEEKLLLLPVSIEKVIVRSNTEAYDLTSSNELNGVEYYAFASEAKVGNQLLIAFNKELPLDQSISLTLSLFNQYPIKLNQFNQEHQDVIPSAKVSWKYFGKSDTVEEESSNWIPLEIVRDETVHFSYSGRLHFKISTPMTPTLIHPANDKRRFWISCNIEELGFELPPRIQRISLNTISAIQRETISQVKVFNSHGEANLTIMAEDDLTYRGQITIQIRDQSGWKLWQEVEGLSTLNENEAAYQMIKDPKEKTTKIMFGDQIHGRIPPAGENNIKMIVYAEEYQSVQQIGASSGVPGQRFELAIKGIIPDTLQIQVGRMDHSKKEFLWEDWYQMDDFDNSKSFDPHYVFNVETNEIIFGNNEQGLIPEASTTDNIVIVACQIGGGERGNVKSGLINKIHDPLPSLEAIRVTNHDFAEGGAEGEGLEETKQRLKREMNHPTRAITNVDYEYIVKQTPGLRVARVKAIPLYELGMKDYPLKKAVGQITIVVVPYSEEKKPLPSKGFLETVKRYIDDYRLITTEVHVIPPEYIKITVHAVVVIEDSYYKEEDDIIVKALNQVLDPLDSSIDQFGWGFGRKVYKGDIYGIINSLAGIAYIQDLWMDAEGIGIHRDENGDIQIPPHGLVYSGDHEIQTISRANL